MNTKETPQPEIINNKSDHSLYQHCHYGKHFFMRTFYIYILLSGFYQIGLLLFYFFVYWVIVVYIFNLFLVLAYKNE